MKRTRNLSRRSFFATVAGGVAAAGAVGLIAPGQAGAMQCTDSDRGASSDPAGRGRRCVSGGSAGCTDSDSGAYSDPAGRGRRCGGNRVAPGQGLNFQGAPGQIRIPVGSAQGMRTMNGRQQFLYNGRWYNLIGNDGGTLIGNDGGT